MPTFVAVTVWPTSKVSGHSQPDLKIERGLEKMSL